MNNGDLRCARCGNTQVSQLATYGMGDHDLTVCDPCWVDYIDMCVAINAEMTESHGPDWWK